MGRLILAEQVVLVLDQGAVEDKGHGSGQCMQTEHEYCRDSNRHVLKDQCQGRKIELILYCDMIQLIREFIKRESLTVRDIL